MRFFRISVKCPIRVKLRRTHCEQMSSGLPLIADIARCSRHFAFVPATDIVRSAGSGYASIVLAPPQPCFRYGRRLVALGALHTALDPVDRLDARRRIDAFGGEV